MNIKEKDKAVFRYEKKKVIFSLDVNCREVLEKINNANRFSTRSHIIETAISHFAKLNKQKQTELLLEKMKG